MLGQNDQTNTMATNIMATGIPPSACCNKGMHRGMDWHHTLKRMVLKNWKLQLQFAWIILLVTSVHPAGGITGWRISWHCAHDYCCCSCHASDQCGNHLMAAASRRTCRSQSSVSLHCSIGLDHHLSPVTIFQHLIESRPTQNIKINFFLLGCLSCIRLWYTDECPLPGIRSNGPLLLCPVQTGTILQLGRCQPGTDRKTWRVNVSL